MAVGSRRGVSSDVLPGLWQDALTAIEQAVAIYLELAAILPVFRESLAESLTSLGIRLTEKKDFDAAPSADREAVAIYAALLSLDPERYLHSLQQAWTNLVIHLRNLGYSEQEIAGELDSLLSADDDWPAFATSAWPTPTGRFRLDMDTRLDLAS
jgi:hypothetical protein